MECIIFVFKKQQDTKYIFLSHFNLQEESAPARKKRQYRKRKQAQQQQQQSQNQSIPHMAVHTFQQQQQHSGGEVDIMDSSDEDLLSPVSIVKLFLFYSVTDSCLSISKIDFHDNCMLILFPLSLLMIFNFFLKIST